MTTTIREHVLRSDKLILKLIFVVAASLSAFQIWQCVTGAIPATYFRPIHLSWVLILIFLRYPLVKDDKSSSYPAGRTADVFLAACSLYCGYVITNFDYQSIEHILNGLSASQFATGGLFLLLVLEATRRSVGWTMAAIAVIFILYAFLGNLLPEVVSNRGFALERIIRFQVFTAAGLFGIPLGIAAGMVFIFVLFGAFLEVTGAGKFFIDLAFAATGKYRGGPAKASVVASAAMGSISGSAIANAVTTGALAIPMMKKLGYRSEQAAGVVAAASTGGQIMPPVMGSGAFIMAEFTGTPYNDIVLISIAPALLFFVCTLLYVHIAACKLGLEGMEEGPDAWLTFKKGFHFIVPLIIVTILLIMKYSPPLVGAAGCAAVVVSSLFRAHSRISISKLLTGLKAGALLALPVSAACATAGVIVGVIGQTGIGLQFSEFIISCASGQLLIALILIASAALILGMGLPVTAAYIILAVIAAPALSGMGLPLVASHMIIFWLSQSSNVTPPIALAAFASAGVANADPMRSAVEAFKLAGGLFVIPLMMAYTGLLFIDQTTAWSFTVAIVCTLVLIASLAYTIEGFAITRTVPRERLMFAFAAMLIAYPNTMSRILGVAAFVTGAALNFSRHRKEKEHSALQF